MGIEPTPSAWKAEVLPLNYTRPVQPPRALDPLPSTPLSMLRRLPGSLLPHGGGGRIRTFEGVSRQIYSLLPLTAWVPHREKRAAYSDFHCRECQCELARVLLWRGGYLGGRKSPIARGSSEGSAPPTLYRGGWAGFPLDSIHQTHFQLPPLPRAEVGRQLDRAVTQPGKPQDLVADCQPHPPDLPIAPLAQNYAESRVESGVRPHAGARRGPGHGLPARHSAEMAGPPGCRSISSARQSSAASNAPA